MHLVQDCERIGIVRELVGVNMLHRLRRHTSRKSWQAITTKLDRLRGCASAPWLCMVDRGYPPQSPVSPCHSALIYATSWTAITARQSAGAQAAPLPTPTYQPPTSPRPGWHHAPQRQTTDRPSSTRLGLECPPGTRLVRLEGRRVVQMPGRLERHRTRKPAGWV